MQAINIYLHFNGKSEEALNYYKSILGGEITVIQRYKDMPGGDKMSPADQGKAMHAALQILPSTLLMASDIMGPEDIEAMPGKNFHICIQAENEKEADRIFNSLCAGGKIEMPMNKTFWGAYFGMCTDKFGIQWMINVNNQ